MALAWMMCCLVDYMADDVVLTWLSSTLGRRMERVKSCSGLLLAHGVSLPTLVSSQRELLPSIFINEFLGSLQNQF